MVQQGQVFRLKATRADGEALWAYRYRVAGRGSARFQVGGFSTRAEAQRALQKKLARLGASGRTTTITLAELVEEYLQTHTGERVTIAKLRWLLGKATAAFGDVRLADLSPEAICAWRLTVPEGHRYEATQALRQVLNRAVAWKLIDDNPAKRGVPNPGGAAGSSGRSTPASRSARLPSSSGRPTGRWCCSPLRQGSDPRSCSRSSKAMSTGGRVSFRSGGHTRTGGSSRPRRG